MWSNARTIQAYAMNSVGLALGLCLVVNFVVGIIIIFALLVIINKY